MKETCDCKDCEALKILLRLQWNLQKGGSTREALDAAIEDKLYVHFSGC